METGNDGPEAGERALDLGAILTGGAARRMGGRKADIVVAGATLVEHTYRRIRCSSRETVCVGGEEYLSRHGVRTIPDLFPGADTMGGIATALKYALDTRGPDAWVLVVGCDMPLISMEVLDLLASRRRDVDIVASHTGPGFEPLCSLYRAGIFNVFEGRIAAGSLRIKDIFGLVRTAVVGEAELRGIDPGLRSFTNINNPRELENLLRETMETPSAEC